LTEDWAVAFEAQREELMKAAQVVKYGDAVEGVELREVPEPAAPKSGEALVGVEFSPINFNDLMVLWGIYAWKPELPATIGNEGAGKVIAIGEGVTSVKVGDRVVLPFTVRKWQQRVLVLAEELIVVPPDADPQQAAMMAINPVTAALLLDQYVDLQPGDAVVYNAATSGLAQWLAALAGRRGVRTIGLVRRREDIERVKQGGCEFVVVDDEEIGTVETRLQGMNVRLALDVIGGSSAGRLLHLLSPKGMLVTYGAVSGKPMELPGAILIFKQLTVEGFFEGHPHTTPKIAPVLRELVKMIGPGGIRQPTTATYPIDRVKEAVAHAVKGGRILLSLS
jgi:NADPH:quinone reductase-like Zn-dependent oxidoreductase